jgi:uncharacterized HAD superfamily protein
MTDRIGLDLDSVLSYTEAKIDQYIRENFGIHIDWANEITNYKLECMPHLTPEMCKELLDTVKHGDLLKDVEPHNYAEHSTKKLRNEGFKIFIISSRPDRLRHATMDWLNKHEIVFDELYLVESLKKYKLIKRLGIKAFVEDRFDVLETIVDNLGGLEFGLYLVQQPWNKTNYNEQVVKVRDIAEAVDRIIEFRKWKRYFLTKCVGDIEKFIKEYYDGK